MPQQTVNQVDADRLAEKHNLGTLRNTYNLYNASSCSYVFTNLFFLIFLIPGFFLPQIIQSNSGDSKYITALLVLLFPSVSIYMIIRTSMARKNALYRADSSLLHYTNGLILLNYEQKQLVSSDALHWQDIALIWHNVRQIQDGENKVTRHTYKIQSKQGDMFGGDAFEFTTHQLGKTVERETVPYLWPDLIASYQQRHPVLFGTIIISLDGIHYDGQVLPWQSLKEVHFDPKGKITIKQKSDTMLSSWAKVSDLVVPNIHLLVTLLDFIRNQQGLDTFAIKNKSGV